MPRRLGTGSGRGRRRGRSHAIFQPRPDGKEASSSSSPDGLRGESSWNFHFEPAERRGGIPPCRPPKTLLRSNPPARHRTARCVACPKRAHLRDPLPRMPPRRTDFSGPARAEKSLLLRSGWHLGPGPRVAGLDHVISSRNSGEENLHRREILCRPARSTGAVGGVGAGWSSGPAGTVKKHPTCPKPPSQV